MGFEQLLDAAIAVLQRRGRVSYKALRLELDIDDEVMDVLREELIDVLEIAEDRDGKMIVFREGAQNSVPSPAALRSAERRVLTVMFCDLEGSTQLSGHLDFEDLREVVRQYQRVAGEAIDRCEGYVAQYLGDGLLVYFGYPIAHENDSLRAVKAGLDIVQRIDSLNESLQPQFGIQLGVRIGIHTGEVVIGDMGEGSRTETLALGLTPNIAARLEGIAPRNGVVVSWVTQAQLEGQVRSDKLGEYELKGIEGPRSVFQIHGVREARPARSDPSSVPFVGRVRELIELTQLWADTQLGSGSAVHLTGAAGIGKTRLVQELIASQDISTQQILVFSAQEDNESSPLRAFTSTLTSEWSISDASPETAIERIEGRLDPEAKHEACIVAEALGLQLAADMIDRALTPQIRRARAFHAIASAICQSGGDEPLLLLFEDLHWFDPSSLELLRLITSRVALHRILIVTTSRPETDPSSLLDGIRTIQLTGLRSELTCEMVKSLSDSNELSDETISSIVEHAEGVPLFIQELTKTLLAEDDFTPVASAAPEGELAIPASIYGCLMARLDRLETARHAAQAAALIGRRFSRDLLLATLQSTECELSNTLVELSEAGLVRSLDNTTGTYEFTHALLRNAAEQSLLRATKREIHGQVADALVRVFPVQVEREPEVLALHLAGAERHADAIGNWRMAGLAALGRFANEEAIAYFAKALTSADQLDIPQQRTAEQLALTVLKAIPMMLTRGWGSPDVRAAYEYARDLCGEFGDAAPPELFPTLIGMGSFFIVTADWAEARRLTIQNLTIARQSNAVDLLAEAETEMGVVELYSGNPDRVISILDRTINEYDPRQHPDHLLLYGRNTQVVAYTTRALAYWTLGYLDSAASDASLAVESARSVTHPFSEAWAMSIHALIPLLRGEIEVALNRANRLCEYADEHGFPYWRGQGLVFRGWAALEDGKLEAAKADFDEGLQIWYASGTQMLDPLMTWPLAKTHCLLAEYDQALEILDRSLEGIESSGEDWWMPEVVNLKGEVIARRDGWNSDIAMSTFHESMHYAANRDALTMQLRAANNIARVHVTRGQRDEAKHLLQPLLTRFQQGHDTRDLMKASEIIV